MKEEINEEKEEEAEQAIKITKAILMEQYCRP